ncbi:hypothetical protein NL676_023894 [Syzygium grande]|nr:hypothetical protein NL676_023894 [Syzygium grande]
MRVGLRENPRGEEGGSERRGTATAAAAAAAAVQGMLVRDKRGMLKKLGKGDQWWQEEEEEEEELQRMGIPLLLLFSVWIPVAGFQIFSLDPRDMRCLWLELVYAGSTILPTLRYYHFYYNVFTIMIASRGLADERDGTDTVMAMTDENFLALFAHANRWDG